MTLFKRYLAIVISATAVLTLPVRSPSMRRGSDLKGYSKPAALTKDGVKALAAVVAMNY